MSERSKPRVVIGAGFDGLSAAKGLAHVYFLIGFRNRFVVALNWAWSYNTFQQGSRLTTGLDARVEDTRQLPRSELLSQTS
jgi:NADH:ubiquinone reductase (H+-translocating)